MFLASRRRRMLLVLIPAVASLLFSLMAFFIMRSSPPNVADWRLLFWITLVFGVAMCLGALLVPEKTRKRERFDALTPVSASFHSWFYERRRRGKVYVPYFLTVVVLSLIHI